MDSDGRTIGDGADAPAPPAAATTDPPAVATEPTQHTDDELLEDVPELILEPILDEHDEDVVFFGGVFRMEDSPLFKLFEEISVRSLFPPAVLEQIRPRIQTVFRGLTQGHGLRKQLQLKNNQLHATISQQVLDMERSGAKQYSDSSEIGELRRELLRVQNDTQMMLDEESRLQLAIAEAVKAKQDLVEDIEEMRRSKAEMLEPQLISATKELKLETIQRTHQIENLTKDLEEKEALLEMSRQEKVRLELELEKHVNALAKANEQPDKIARQAEAIRDGLQALELESHKQDTLCASNTRDLQQIVDRKHQLEEVQAAQNIEMEQCRKRTQEIERQCDEIFREYEWKSEQLVAHQQEAVRLAAAYKQAVADIQVDHDRLLKSLRDKDVAVKTFRRLTNTVNNVRMALPGLRQQLENARNELDATLRDSAFYKNKGDETRKQIDLALFQFLGSEKVHAEHKQLLSGLKADFAKLEAEWKASVLECRNLSREAEQLELEKDVRARDHVKTQNRLRVLREDVQVKNVMIADATKRLAEAGTRLKEIVRLYESVKAERNKFVDMIQATHQKGAEMRDKIRILASEVEILRQEIIVKDRELVRQSQDKAATFAVRDLVKSEANKTHAAFRDRRDQIDRHLARIESLNATISIAAGDMTLLKKRYESACLDRNAAATSLIERNDELCVMYEKINIQEKHLENGEAALRERDEEIRVLTIALGEVQREVENVQRRMPALEACRGDIARLQAEIAAVQAEQQQLDRELETAPEERIRDLGGADPTHKELLDKMARLESALAQREEKLLEMDLVLAEVSTLADRLRARGTETRDDAAATSDRLNHLSKRISTVTKNAMARISELSLAQAQAMTLFQQKCAKETLVAQASARVARNEPPTDEIAAAVAKSEQRRVADERVRHQRASRARAVQRGGGPPVHVDEDNFYVYNRIRTKAEPRPTAYIPSKTGNGTIAPGSQLAELPLPKPYGAFAPFKPQEPGPHLLFYRKPAAKAIEY